MNNLSKTWSDAARRWCQEMTHKRSLNRDIEKFKYLSVTLANCPLKDINKLLIAFGFKVLFIY